MISVQEAIKRFSKVEFNPKFGETIGFDPERKKFIYVNRLEERNYLITNWARDPFYLEKEAHTKEKGNTILVGNILPQYFNSQDARQAFYLIHLPVRVTKFGLNFSTNANFISPFWDSLPNALKREFGTFSDNLNESISENIATQLTVLNEHFKLTFEDAVEKVCEKQMFSAAFDPNWLLSYSAHHEGMGVYYRNIHVGVLNTNKQEVEIVQPLLAQELKDLFVKKAIKQWSIEG